MWAACAKAPNQSKWSNRGSLLISQRQSLTYFRRHKPCGPPPVDVESSHLPRNRRTILGMEEQFYDPEKSGGSPGEGVRVFGSCL